MASGLSHELAAPLYFHPTFFCFNVKTLSNTGSVYAVGAVVVVQTADFYSQEIDSLFLRCPLSACPEFKADSEEIKLAEQQVLPHLTNAVCYRNPADLKEAFWAFYAKFKISLGAALEVVVETPLSPECTFFRECMLHNDVANREKLIAYPIHSLGTLILASPRRSVLFFARDKTEMPVHNAMMDARYIARLWVSLYPLTHFIVPVNNGRNFPIAWNNFRQEATSAFQILISKYVGFSTELPGFRTILTLLECLRNNHSQRLVHFDTTAGAVIPAQVLSSHVIPANVLSP